MVLHVGMDHLGAFATRRDDDLGPDQAVAGHAEVAVEGAEAAADRRTDQADAALASGRDREVLLGERRHRFLLGQAGADRRDTSVGVDVDRLELADVDHDAVVDVRPALQGVAAAAYPQCDVVLPRPGEGVHHVLGLLGEDDDQRVVGEQLVVVDAIIRVRSVTGADDVTGQLRRPDIPTTL